MSISWHPKISPYRLSVISTTIAFGTAKIVESQTGNTVIPTTLEWVAGTVFLLIIFSVSSYDSREEIPQYISWLFKPDCMDILWRILSVVPSRYRTEERMTQNDLPAVTLFRLLLSSTVVMFGMAKAVLGYFGQSTAMNWTDWIFAVPVTMIFYILGLYEYNAANIWPSFYVTDRRGPLFYGIEQSFLIALFVPLTGLTLYGNIYSIQHLYNGTPETIFGPLGITTNDSLTNPVRKYTNYAFLRSLQLLMLAILVVSAVSLTVSLFAISPPVRNVGILILSQFRKIRRTAFRMIGPSVNSIPLFLSNAGSRGYLREYQRVQPLLQHIFWHLCGLACCLMPSGLVAGLTVNTFDAVAAMVSTPTAIGVSISILIALCCLILVVIDMLLVGFVLYSLFFRYNKL